jgi:hypothetical protein
VPHSHATILYGFKLLIPDGQHGKIVALVGLTGKEVDSSTHTLNQWHGLTLALDQLFFCQLKNLLLAKLLMLAILCLIQTIGI